MHTNQAENAGKLHAASSFKEAHCSGFRSEPEQTMNKSARILAALALLAPAAALAANSANDSFLELGYRYSKPDAVSKSNQGYIRGSIYLEEGVSFIFEGASGGLDQSFVGSTTHTVARAGLAYRVPRQFGYWELAGSVASEEYGNRTDQYGRLEYGAHGWYRSGFGWDAALLANFKDGVADRTGGLLLGVRYRFTNGFGVVLDGEGYQHDKTYHLGVQWYF
jgi:hypothetical protein